MSKKKASQSRFFDAAWDFTPAGERHLM